MSDFTRIYLQPGKDDPDPEYGRTWCSERLNGPGDQDLDCPGDTEYVRADLYDALQAEITALRERFECVEAENVALRDLIEWHKKPTADAVEGNANDGK